MRIISVLLLFLSIFLTTTQLFAMPPAPGVVEMLRSENRLQSVVQLHNSARERGMNQPVANFNINSLKRDGADDITINAICILVEFDDNQANQDAFSAEHFQEMLFSVDEYQTGSMRDWFLENSYGTINVTGVVAGWYEMPNSYDYYVDGQQGFGRYPRNAQRLAEDALNAADDDIDFSEFDNNDNNVVEALFVVHAGNGAEATGSDDMIWSHAWGVPGGVVLDGMRFDRYAMEPENGRIGVFGHELGHSGFNLPDLYDTSYESAGIGNWSMMSGGSWGGGGLSPVHFDAWCKYRIGVIDPFPIIMNHENLILEPAGTDDDVLMMWTEDLDEWGSEFFLVENRQMIGFDRSLPGSGILIWHIDERMGNNQNAWYPEIGRNAHNIVALEQADGSYNLERNQNGGDSGDPFPGSGWVETFSEDTVPDSRDYRLNSTGITIHNIERADSIHYRFNITLGEGYQPETLSLFLLSHVPENHTYPHPDDRTGEIMTNETDLVSDLLHEIDIRRFSSGDELPENLDDYNMVIYLESWREEDGSSWSLSENEQLRLRNFLRNSGKLVLIGPDIATNLQGEDNPLWEYVNAEYYSEGLPREDGNMRRIQANGETRFAGQSFPYQVRGAVDHFVDEVGPRAGAHLLFNDNGGLERGIVSAGEDGSRVILQPFLFGGLIDWGGTKNDLLTMYFQHMQLTLAVSDNFEPDIAPGKFELLSAWPNPFNSRVNFQITGTTSTTSINIYDFNGRHVDFLQLNGRSNAVSWNPINLPTGSYFAVPTEANNVTPIQVIYLK